jgi:cholesterol oxidase
MSGPSFRFTEEMRGYVAFGERDYHCGAAAGREAESRLRVRLTVEVDDLARFTTDPNREARIAGWIDWEALGGRLPIERGVFNLLVGAEDTERQQIRYRLFVRDGVGHPVTLAGEKRVGAPGLRVWSDTTTLYVRVLSGHAEAEDEGDAELIATGIVRLRPIDFARQITTFRATGPSPIARMGTIARFDLLFARLLWWAYGPPALRRVRATGWPGSGRHDGP